jgi:hypothetical protein
MASFRFSFYAYLYNQRRFVSHSTYVFRFSNSYRFRHWRAETHPGTLTWLRPTSKNDAVGLMRNSVYFHSNHEVQFYSSDTVLLECFARFIARALKSHNPVIVLATELHREGLIQKLAGAGFDVDDAIKQGIYISLDAAETLSTIMVNGGPDRLRFFDGLSSLIETAAKAAKTEHPRVAICGEGVGLLCVDGNMNAAIQVEEVGNDLAQSYDVDILCAYPLNSFREEDSNAYERVCAEHTAVYSR